jgi:hypothetical protein
VGADIPLVSPVRVMRRVTAAGLARFEAVDARGALLAHTRGDALRRRRILEHTRGVGVSSGRYLRAAVLLACAGGRAV